jgi:hypothetical protein
VIWIAANERHPRFAVQRRHDRLGQGAVRVDQGVLERIKAF